MIPAWDNRKIATVLLENRHRLFLKWMIFTGVLVFAFLVAWHQGFMAELYTSDRSHISVVITILFIATTGHCAFHTYRISKQLNDTSRVWEILNGEGRAPLAITGDTVRTGNGTALPRCLLTSYIAELLEQFAAGRDLPNILPERDRLLDAYTHQIRSHHEFGWFIADIVVKLGLLGTVVGFIMMLGTVTGITQFDANVMQELLINMSGGMKVALYTTLSGLIGAMLLAVQYNFLEQGTDDLVAMMVKVVEVQVAVNLIPAPKNPGERAGKTAS